MWRVLVSCFVALQPTVALAQDYPIYSAERAGSPQFQQCISVNSSNVGEANCLEAEYRRQSALLELAYQEQIRGRSPAERQALIAAQSAWLAFRRANCRTRGMVQGSGAAVFMNGCLVRETITRRREIEELWDY